MATKVARLDKTLERVGTWEVDVTEEKVWIKRPGHPPEIVSPSFARRLSEALARAATKHGE